MSAIGQVQEAVTLASGQQKALLAVLNAEPGSFHFITGKAGTGKSTILRALRGRCRCIVGAPTGLAAVNVGGMSIHSLFSIPIGPVTKGKVSGVSFPAKRRAIEVCDLVVIEEISMVRADLLDGINWVLQKTLHNELPFGGKTVVAFGDMWQLEPVTADDREWLEHNYKSPFWFDAKVFKPEQARLEDGEATEIITHELSEVFRQSDAAFIEALNLVRIGDPAGLALINSRAHAQPEKGHEPVTLTYTNNAAESINSRRLSEIDAEVTLFHAKIDGEFGKEQPAPTELALKVGAQVMVTRNIVSDYEQMIANGAIGTVAGFLRGTVVVELRDGRVSAIAPISWEKIKYDFDKEKNTLIEAVAGTFSQIPLKPAWAITTHKSQGQTLDAAVLQLESRTFSHGQLYVALSRVRGLDGLYLRRVLQASDLVVNKRVREFCGIEEPKFNAEALL